MSENQQGTVNQLEPLTREVLLQILAEREHDFSIGDEGRPYLLLSPENGYPCPLEVSFIGAEPESSFFAVQITASKRIFPRLGAKNEDNLVLANLICNVWNKDNLWLTTYVRPVDEEKRFFTVCGKSIMFTLLGSANRIQVDMTIELAIEDAKKFWPSVMKFGL